LNWTSSACVLYTLNAEAIRAIQKISFNKIALLYDSCKEQPVGRRCTDTSLEASL